MMSANRGENMLTDRQLIILQTIIDSFIETAHPVGSRLISKDDSIGLSAATIRNVMADLEDLKLLEKTHSSSGRVPSEKGYRYYVDHVISPSIKEHEVDIINHLIEENIYEYEQVVQTSADVLSELTNYTTIVLGPEVIKARLKQIQFITLTKTQAVAILITDTGHVEHKSLTIPPSLRPSELEKIVNILNEKLVGVPITSLEQKLESEIYHLLKQHISEHELMFRYLKTVMKYDQPNKLYIGGQTNLLTQPEFSDIEKVHALYKMMEDESKVMEILSQNEPGIRVTIGNENDYDPINQLSLIRSSYEFGSGQLGTIALLGPTRMEYKKVITLLQSVAQEMSDILNQTKE